MAKADFEFYQLDGLEGEFVVPRPDCDPYRGTYDIRAIPELAMQTITKIVEKWVGPATLNVAPATPEETGGYFFNIQCAGSEVVRQKATITAKLGEDAGFCSEALGRVLGSIDNKGRRAVIPTQREAKGKGWPEKLIMNRELAGIEEYLYLLDEKGAPTHPYLSVRQVVPFRAFRWLPGPERISRKGRKLRETYGPRPVKLAVAQLVTIQGINPLALS